ncbi:MAG: hypothetical protein H0T79_07275 [Deltaproteobacteria bacterium]|nr:hypothetical protein [Deltaproteobacteria bacterium]
MTNSLRFCVLALLASCSDDPVSYSAPVSINLKAKSGDVSGTTVSEEKGINTESGNPYGAFVTDATRRLGRDPGSISIEEVTLTLGAQSNNVVTLQEVYSGDVDVAFIIDDSNNTYDVGHVIDPAGVGPVGVDVNFEGVSEVDYTKLLKGSFKVVIRGTAAVGFASKGAEADLQVSFTFAAFE